MDKTGEDRRRQEKTENDREDGKAGRLL